jgi:hypothetical protein
MTAMSRIDLPARPRIVVIVLRRLGDVGRAERAETDNTQVKQD